MVFGCCYLCIKWRSLTRPFGGVAWPNKAWRWVQYTLGRPQGGRIGGSLAFHPHACTPLCHCRVEVFAVYGSTPVHTPAEQNVVQRKNAGSSPSNCPVARTYQGTGSSNMCKGPTYRSAQGGLHRRHARGSPLTCSFLCSTLHTTCVYVLALRATCCWTRQHVRASLRASLTCLLRDHPWPYYCCSSFSCYELWVCTGTDRKQQVFTVGLGWPKQPPRRTEGQHTFGRSMPPLT